MSLEFGGFAVCIGFGVDMQFRDYIGLGIEKGFEFVKGLGFARWWGCILAVCFTGLRAWGLGLRVWDLDF